MIQTLSRRKGLILSFLLLISLTALCYLKYWGNVWYLQDDYFTVDLGGTDSIWNAGQKMSSWLYMAQQRYQPVRLFIFSLATHLVPEEFSFVYNFGLHLLNIGLLFLLIRAFRVHDYLAFITAALFSVYGVFRMMESPSAMIGGSGLNTFFLLAALFFLSAGMETSSAPRKYAFLGLSYLSYCGLVFTYEVAFPMFLTVLCGFVLFKRIFKGDPLFLPSREYFILTPYVGFLAIYYFLFRLQPSPYEATQITISLNVLTRFFSYSKALLMPFTKFIISPRPEIFVALLLYYPAVYLIMRQARKGGNFGAAVYSVRNHYFLLLFGIVWYLSSISLFILNNWMSPTSVMHHHLYLITVGSAIWTSNLIFCIHFLIPPPMRNIYRGMVIYFIYPLLLINSLNFNLHHGELSGQKTQVLYQVKKQIQNYIPDVKTVDALILKNFLKPKNLHYYQISHLNGALLQWFDYKKYIESGDDILSAKDGKITFKGPLSYYHHILRSKTITVANDKTEILYYDSETKKLLPYKEYIDFQKGINLHQTKQVRNSNKAGVENAFLEAILRNPGRFQFLSIFFDAPIKPFAFSNYAIIYLNDVPQNEAYFSKETLSLDISRFQANNKFLFLFLNSPRAFGSPQTLKSISFHNFAEGTKLPLRQSANFDFQSYQFFNHIYDTLRFLDWYDEEPTHRWAKGKKAAIQFVLPSLNSAIKHYEFILEVGSHGPQRVDVFLNGKELDHLSLSGFSEVIVIRFSADLLQANAMNTLEFHIPGAKKPNSSDPRILGLALKSFLLKPIFADRGKT